MHSNPKWHLILHALDSQPKPPAKGKLRCNKNPVRVPPLLLPPVPLSHSIRIRVLLWHLGRFAPLPEAEAALVVDGCYDRFSLHLVKAWRKLLPADLSIREDKEGKMEIVRGDIEETYSIADTRQFSLMVLCIIGPDSSGWRGRRRRRRRRNSPFH
jgi:hypothetical protein